MKSHCLFFLIVGEQHCQSLLVVESAIPTLDSCTAVRFARTTQGQKLCFLSEHIIRWRVAGHRLHTSIFSADNKLCLWYPAFVWTINAMQQHEVRTLLQLLLTLLNQCEFVWLHRKQIHQLLLFCISAAQRSILLHLLLGTVQKNIGEGGWILYFIL